MAGTGVDDDVTVRRLGRDDVAIFRRIRLDALASDPIAFASTHADWVAFSEEDWLRRLDEPVFAAFRGGEAVGLMGHMAMKPTKMAHRTLLIMVWVRPEARSAGVAERLIEAVAVDARAAGFRWLELDVCAEQIAAIRFYEKTGFREVGRIPGGLLHEGRELDQILMVRRLAEADDIGGRGC